MKTKYLKSNKEFEIYLLDEKQGIYNKIDINIMFKEDDSFLLNMQPNVIPKKYYGRCMIDMGQIEEVSMDGTILSICDVPEECAYLSIVGKVKNTEDELYKSLKVGDHLGIVGEIVGFTGELVKDDDEKLIMAHWLEVNIEKISLV